MNDPHSTRKTGIFRAAFSCPLIVYAAAALLAACGGGGGAAGSSASSAAGKFDGTAVTPARPAPQLPLKDYLGRPTTESQLRGKAILVTFIYTHCPDVCPLIVSHLHAAQDELGPGSKKLKIIAVSVDPSGDTPRTVARFLEAHQMTGRMTYLIGSRPRLERVWRAWNVISKDDPKNPDQVEHSASIYGISGGGKLSTVYPLNFAPRQIVHDVPLLATQ